MDFNVLEDNTDEVLSNFRIIINERMEDTIKYLVDKGEDSTSIGNFVTKFFKKFETLGRIMSEKEVEFFHESFQEELEEMSIDQQLQRMEELMQASTSGARPKKTKRKTSIEEPPQNSVNITNEPKPKINKKSAIERPLQEREELNKDRELPIKPKLMEKTKEKLPNTDAKGTKRDFYKLEEDLTKEKTKLEEDKDLDTVQEINNKTQKKEIRPPPIFIKETNLEKIKIHLLALNISEKEVILKTVSRSKTKLMIKSEELYKQFLAYLNLKEIEYYTFQNFHGKIAKRLIKGLPVNYDKDRLKKELDMLEFIEIKNVTQISHRITNAPLPLFRIDFRWYNKIWEKLEKIQKIDNYDVTFEAMDISLMEIPICKNCLNYGHTKRYCKLKITCIICNGHHFSDKCTLVEKARLENTPIRPKCLHCGEAHFSTWKGCNFYKKMRKQKIDYYKKQNELNTDKNKQTKTDKRGSEANESNKDDEIKRLRNQIQTMETEHRNERLQFMEEINSLKKEIQEIKSCLHLVSQSKVSP
ncbi:unnamed protein product [Bemisia tabaci]|uniref:Pre-C2HC domain-containing protein n=1 Tax=Bemisia tabaci TaxID=7038 RepID=A0A9P0FAX6_BEMTA|nr:unnamed protein product [Bemisia tabaci]